MQEDTGVLPSEANEWFFKHRNLIAAASGSFVSTIAGFPLDSVKSRLQVKRYSGVLDVVTRTLHDEGIKGFFRGVTIPLLTITVVRTASFSIYTGVKEEFYSRHWLQRQRLSGTATAGLAGGAASGLLLSVGTSAFEYTKIKLQLEYLIAVKKGVPYEPRGTVQGFLDLWRAGSIRSLYTGFKLHALRDTIGTGIYFSLYDSAQYIISTNAAVVPPMVSTFACGSTAGILSWAVIYPIDLVKSKIQRNALADSPRETAWSIFRRLSSNGVTRLYRGLGVSAVRSILQHGLMWSVLELVRNDITRRTGHSPWEDLVESRME